MKQKSELLSKFQRKYKHHINLGLVYIGIGKLKDWIDFDFDVYLPSKGKNLQRDLCWTQLQKESLIFTILRDQKINSIVVVQHKEKDKNSNYQFKVIDGKQRLTTVFSYLNNEFSINVDGVNYFFKDLPEDCQDQIKFYNFTWNVHYSYEDQPISDDTLIDIFEDCNFLGTSQDKEHLNNLRS